MKSLSEYIKEQLIQESLPSVNWVLGFLNDLVIDGSKKRFDGKVYIFSRNQTADGDVKITDSKVYDEKTKVSSDDIYDALKKEKFVVVCPKDKKLAEYLVDEYEFEDEAHNVSMDNACGIFLQKLVDNHQKLALNMINDNSIC